MTPTEDRWTVYSLTVSERQMGEVAIPIPTFIAMHQAVTTANA